jgi:predicted nucleic acid-binding protein
MPWAIIDTGIYIGHWERGLHQKVLQTVRRGFVVRHSAVVLSELRRGARTRKAEQLAEALYRLAHVRWEPSAPDWWEAGKLVRDVGDTKHWERSKRREFQNDALIALTARRHGATVVTDNRVDFEVLAERIGIEILVV